jgi:putative ABC transport system ATP-binding protein
MSSSVVQLSGVTFRWRPQIPLTLDGLDFNLSPGESLFVHGPSGSGKTTLLNLIAGVAMPEQGDVHVLDQSLTQLSPANRDAFRADHIGLIFQMFNLVPYLTVVENILLPCRFSARRRDKAVAKDGNLDAAAKRLLGGWSWILPTWVRARHRN